MPLQVVGDLAVLIERLHEEYVKSLQNIDPHKTEYVARIGDEQGLTALAERAYDYYGRVAGRSDRAAQQAAAAAAKASEADNKAQLAEAAAARTAAVDDAKLVS
jgi:hypothetical protein